MENINIPILATLGRLQVSILSMPDQTDTLNFTDRTAECPRFFDWLGQNPKMVSLLLRKAQKWVRGNFSPASGFSLSQAAKTEIKGPTKYLQ
jgi:hypothetical protein